MSDIVLILFVEFVVVHPIEGLAPEGYCFIYRKTKNLSNLSAAGRVHLQKW